VLKLAGDFAHPVPAYRILLAIRVEETDNALRLLKRLNEAVQQKPVKTPVTESDTILVMLVESVHGPLLCGEIPGAKLHGRLLGQRSPCESLEYQGRSPWLVSSNR